MRNYVIFASLALVSFVGFWVSLFYVSIGLSLVFLCFTVLYGFIAVTAR